MNTLYQYDLILFIIRACVISSLLTNLFLAISTDIMLISTETKNTHFYKKNEPEKAQNLGKMLRKSPALNA